MAKYARILMTGFRSAPIDPDVLRQFNNNQNSFKSFPLNKIKVKNITLFSDYNFTVPNPELVVLTGVDTLYESNYSGNLYAKITGIAEFIDAGETNAQGVYNASGYHTGTFSGGQTFYDAYGREVVPINKNFVINSSNNVKYPLSGVLTGNKNKNNISPLEVKLENVSSTINAPLVYRSNTYNGVYTGTVKLRDNFYNENTYTVSFAKDYDYIVTGNQYWFDDFNVVNPIANNPGDVPGTFVLNKVMNNGTGYVNEIRNIIASGNIPKVRLPRKNLIGRSVLTGFLTGTVSPANFGIGGVGSGFKNFLKLITGSGINAIQDYATGYLNAFNYLNYNAPEEFDSISIEDPVNDTLSTFTYATGSLFNPPLYFDSITTLNNIINSGSGSYGVYSQIVGSKLKLTSATSGESGNLIFIQTFGSINTPTLETGNYLLSGQSYYESLVSTGVFSSFAQGTVLATGLMTQNYSNYITGNMTGILGNKTFLNTWNIYTSDNSISYVYLNGYPSLTSNTGINYSTNYIDESANYLYNINVRYININNNIYDDIAQLKIILNNEQEIIINLTGV
jgi:hypothetical protein